MPLTTNPLQRGFMEFCEFCGPDFLFRRMDAWRKMEAWRKMDAWRAPPKTV